MLQAIYRELYNVGGTTDNGFKSAPILIPKLDFVDGPIEIHLGRTALLFSRFSSPLDVS